VHPRTVGPTSPGQAGPRTLMIWAAVLTPVVPSLGEDGPWRSAPERVLFFGPLQGALTTWVHKAPLTAPRPSRSRSRLRSSERCHSSADTSSCRGVEPATRGVQSPLSTPSGDAPHDCTCGRRHRPHSPTIFASADVIATLEAISNPADRRSLIRLLRRTDISGRCMVCPDRQPCSSASVGPNGDGRLS
jgi:hypothetical protein